jgi:hypothetical protein
MGHSASTTNSLENGSIFSSLMPLYYTTSPVTVTDVVYASIVCEIVLRGTGYQYKAEKARAEFTHPTCAAWFTSVFYGNLLMNSTY